MWVQNNISFVALVLFIKWSQSGIDDDGGDDDDDDGDDDGSGGGDDDEFSMFPSYYIFELTLLLVQVMLGCIKIQNCSFVKLSATTVQQKYNKSTTRSS